MKTPPPPRDPAVRRLRVMRWSANSGRQLADDAVAAEEPLEIRVDTHPVSVTMRTPGHDDELAAGFLLTEGLLARREDVAGIRPDPRNRTGNTLDVFLAPTVTLDLKQLTRHVFASSSCGLCGKASIAAVQRKFPRVRDRFVVSGATLLALPGQLRATQTGFGVSGGLHAAAIFSADGQLRVMREDVGRHNAVDKVLGHALLNGWLPLQRQVLLVSGRASFEILQKALAARVAVVAAVSAPSSLAVEFAHSNGQTLVGFLREGRFNVYSGIARVTLPRGASGRAAAERLPAAGVRSS